MMLSSPEFTFAVAAVALAQCLAAALALEILSPTDRQRRTLTRGAWLASLALAAVISLRFALVLG
jgi:hypothetical protein